MTEEVDGCCPAAYVCPSSGEVECRAHSGFDCCCADRSCPGYQRLSPWRWLRWARVQFGYWLRPYDMLADRRRWKWRPRQRCGLGGVPPETAAALIAAVKRMEDADDPSEPARPDPRGER